MTLLRRLSLALSLVALTLALLTPVAEAISACDGMMCHNCAPEEPCPSDMARECGTCLGVLALAEEVFAIAFDPSDADAPVLNAPHKDDSPPGQDPPPPRT